MLRNADGGVGGGGCQIFRKKRYECVRCNVIIVTRGWVGVQFPEKKRYVTLEWPLLSSSHLELHDTGISLSGKTHKKLQTDRWHDQIVTICCRLHRAN